MAAMRERFIRARPGSAVFEIRADEDYANYSFRVEFRSRMYDLQYTIMLRREWGSPGPLVDYIERLVGGTLRAWEHAQVSPGEGHAMAIACMPTWEPLIHRHMERIEYESRRYNDRWTLAADHIYGVHVNHPGYWGPPPEDPKAKEKARQLLMRNLDAGQEKSFKKDGTFRVTGQDKKVYTISTARSFNVKAEDGTRYCGQLTDTPVEDQMLAQKLLLEHDPEKFFKNANVAPVVNRTDSNPITPGLYNLAAMPDILQQWVTDPRPGDRVRVNTPRRFAIEEDVIARAAAVPPVVE